MYEFQIIAAAVKGLFVSPTGSAFLPHINTRSHWMAMIWSSCEVDWDTHTFLSVFRFLCVLQNVTCFCHDPELVLIFKTKYN